MRTDGPRAGRTGGDSEPQMHALVRDRDWSATPIGPRDTWPISLRTLVDAVLDHPFPTILLWGPELVQIYNDGYRVIAGDKHPVALGQPNSECWPEVWHINQPIFQRVMEQGQSVQLEDQLFPLERYGSLEDCYFTLSYSPARNDDGEVAGVLLTVFETTERLEAEAALRQSEQELRQRARRKDEFLAILAHELRNPMGPIRNALELLRRKQGDAEAVGSAFAMLERQVVQMARLVDDLVDVGRISRGRIELRREPTDLVAVVRETVASVRSTLDRDASELTVTLPDAPVHLDADAARLTQVLGNLLDNADKFTPAGGRIEVIVDRDGGGDGDGDDGEAVVRVRDSGIGIAPRDLERIFEMFTQANGSTERSRDGLGIGLNLAKTLVEMHGGTLEVASEGPGAGSEFTVRLPLSNGQGAARGKDRVGPSAKAKAKARVSAPARKVLVVDDNRDSAASLAELLELDGHEARAAFSGREALDMAESFAPDVVLLDLGMPEMSGYEVARALRERPWGGDALLVAVTGWGQEADRQRTREASFDVHLVKPVTLPALRELVARGSVE